MSSKQLGAVQAAELAAAAVNAKKHAYCPYSKFRVGAALLGTSGKIYTGCNVENSAYGSTICAERTAVCKAVSEGEKTFVAIAIATDVMDRFIPPCGACRQFMIEFGDYEIILAKDDGSTERHSTGSVLPGAFTPIDLQRPRDNNTNAATHGSNTHNKNALLDTSF